MDAELGLEAVTDGIWVSLNVAFMKESESSLEKLNDSQCESNTGWK